jgi:Asp-tRNA(Asn)/Glu-tRNA(Gln) amidotransferase A subunit family amidase
MRDDTLAAANATHDALAAGRPPGRLHGVPVTAKINVGVAGHPTAAALPALPQRTGSP